MLLRLIGATATPRVMGARTPSGPRPGRRATGRDPGTAPDALRPRAVAPEWAALVVAAPRPVAPRAARRARLSRLIRRRPVAPDDEPAGRGGPASHVASGPAAQRGRVATWDPLPATPAANTGRAATAPVPRVGTAARKATAGVAEAVVRVVSASCPDIRRFRSAL